MKTIGFSKRRTRHLIFYIVLLIWPALHFAVFTVGMNINSVVLAFSRFDVDINGYVWSGFENFEQVVRDFFGSTALYQLKKAYLNSLLGLVLAVLIVLPVNVLFSYYIFRNRSGHTLFKIFLFLPNILSAIVMTTLFRYFVGNVIPELWAKIFHKSIPGLMNVDSSIRFGTVLFYSVWFSFGGNVLLYSGTMASIDPSIFEAARIDGAGAYREFKSVLLPALWPLLTIFITTSCITFLTNQLNLFSFFGGGAAYEDYTIGYYVYVNTVGAVPSDYPYLSAMGVFMTVVFAPIAMLVNKALKKFGPSED